MVVAILETALNFLRNYLNANNSRLTVQTQAKEALQPSAPAGNSQSQVTSSLILKKKIMCVRKK